METIKDIFKRLTVETIIASSLIAVFVLGLYVTLPNPLQLLLLKAAYISVGILHAHIMGKLIIPEKVNWGYKVLNQNGAFIVRSLLYITIPICYAIGS